MKRYQTQKRFFISAILIFSLVFGPAFPVYAAADEWRGTLSDDWLIDGNWLGGDSPDIGDSVFVAYSAAPNSPIISTAGIQLNNLTVGYLTENGNLTLTGAVVDLSTQTASIGEGVGGGVGIVNMDAGAVWSNASTFNVGVNKGDGLLALSGAATITNAGHFFVGSSQGQGEVTLTNAGSLIDITGSLYIGVTDGDGQMTVSDGATLRTGASRDVYIGDDGGTGTLALTDAGTILDGKDSAFVVGDDGGTGTMNVVNGAFAEVGGIVLGNAGGSSGSLLVDASQMTDYQSTVVGEKGIGSMLVDHSALMTTLGEGRVGNAGGGDGTVTLQRSGSWDVQTKLLVGNNYSTGAINMNEGILTTGAAAYIGIAGGTGFLTMENLSTYTSNSELQIGYSGIGDMQVLSGSTVAAKDNLYVGAIDADSDGTLSVSGAGSQVNVDKATHIGASGGTGVVNISDSGLIQSLASAYVGNGAGSSGTVNVDGAGSNWAKMTDVFIGYDSGAAGFLNITNGGNVSNDSIGETYLGASGGVGTARLGDGSTWTNNGNLYIGKDGGDGSLDVLSASIVTTAWAALLATPGGGSGGVAAITVDGTGSGWFVGSDLEAGLYFGASTSLNVTNDGYVQVDGRGIFSGDDGTVSIGVKTGGDLVFGNTVTLGEGADVVVSASVKDAGSTWINNSNFSAGVNGADVAIEVSLEGQMTVAGDMTLADGAGSSLDLTVQDSSSLLHVSGVLTLGSNSGIGDINILSGGEVQADSGSIIGYLGGTATAVVSGVGSAWTNASVLDVGNDGTATLEVLSGGEVTSTGQINIGRNAAGSGSVLVDGSGSLLSSSGAFALGRAGGTGTLTIANQGQVTAAGFAIGTSAVGSVGILNIGAALGDAAVAAGTLNTTTVAGGIGSGQINFNHTDSNYLFSSMITGNVQVTNAAGETYFTGANYNYSGDTFVTGGTFGADGSDVASSSVYIATAASEEALMEIKGGSSWTTGGQRLYVGLNDGLGSLIISEGSSLTGSGRIGLNGGLGDVTVTGAGTTWDHSGHFRLGYDDGGGAGTASMIISDGAVVSSAIGINTIGYGTGSIGEVFVRGAGSVWDVDDELRIGEAGGTGYITIEDGGYVSSSLTKIGIGLGTNAYALVTGAGSIWDMSSDFYLGTALDDADFTVELGAVVNTAGDAYVGDGATATALVTDAGSEWNIDGALYVGTNAGDGTLDVENGALLDVGGIIYVGNDAGSLGNLSVTGATTMLSAGDMVYIGLAGGQAEASVLAGASVTSTGHVLVGSGNGSTGLLTISGAGSTWTSSARFAVGDSEGEGHLILDDQAVLNAGAVYLGLNDGEGIITVSNDAVLSATNIFIGNVGANSVGVLNIGAAVGDAAVAAGQVTTTGSIQASFGTGEINFNHTETDYEFDNDVTGDIEINQYSGTTIATGTATLSLDMNIIGGRFILDGNYSAPSAIVGASGLFGGTGTLTGDLLNDGTVSPGEVTTPGTLTIDGDYIANNGSLLINTVLGLDASATDRLIITGTASGTTTVYVTNRGGLGGVTTGDGIKIIDTGSATAGVFTLNGGEVAAGGYIYKLYQGGLDPLDDPNDFFLRSGGVRPEIPSYVPAPATSVFYVNQSIGTLADRVDLGQNFLNKQSFALNMGDDGGLASLAAAEGVWVRAFGGHRRFESGDANNSSFSGSFGGMQVGKDIWREEYNDGSKNNIGIFASRGYGSGDLSSNLGPGGDTSFTSTALGAYWTHYRPNDTYFNSTLQYTRINGMKINPIGGSGIETSGNSYAASLEVGKPIKISRHSKTTIEPQAQITYQYIDFADAYDGVSSVAFDSVNSVTGRVGFRASHTSQTKSGLGLQPWARFNIAHTLSDDSVLTLAGTDSFRTSLSGTTGEIETGFTVGRADPNGVGWGVYTTLGYQFSLSGPKTSGWMGSLGVRFNW